MCHLEKDHSPAILVNAVKLGLHVLVLLPGPLLNDRLDLLVTELLL